jgi:hypothetical protein
LLSRSIENKIYRTVILPVVLYGHETWFLTVGEEHSLRVLENRVLRRIFEPKRGDITGYLNLRGGGITGDLKKLHNDGLCYLYF